MTKTILHISAMLVCISLAMSCEAITEEPNTEQTCPDVSELTGTEKSIDDILMQEAVIGEEQPNPYRTENLKKALGEISKQTKAEYSEDLIEATHHYVVFLPECHEHYRRLVLKDDLDLYPYPLDHQVSDGWIMTDPAYSINGIQHRWTYVPMDYDLESIGCPYEVLYDVMDLDNCPDPETRSSNIYYTLYQELVKISHQLCNLSLPEIVQTKSAVVPSGNITYRDSTLGKYIGCYGMSVKARRLTKTSYGHCDENGDFRCDKSYKHKWDYTVFFSRTDFEMRRDTTSTDEITLKFSDYHGPLNLVFSKSSKYIDCIFYCEILRAACRYYYGAIDGLRRPPYKNELSDRLYIQAMRGATPSGGTTGFYRHTYTRNSRPTIRVYRDNPFSHDRRSSAEVFNTTIHELAHASHWNQNPYFFVHSCESKVKESFATGIGICLTWKYHPSFRLSYHTIYTGIVEDLMDNDNHKAQSPTIAESVSGFTISEVENSIIGVATWDQWADNIVSLYPYNQTVSEVYNLFAIW